MTCLLRLRLPYCIEDIGYYDNRVTKRLTNSFKSDFDMSKQYRYNENVESYAEQINYQMFLCTHGKDCCKEECIKESYNRNISRITEIYSTKFRQRWLWPFCMLCRVWICFPCFRSCFHACIPVEPIAINRDKNVCKCHFQRVCKAHLARFKLNFVNFNLPSCPAKFRCRRSNTPLKEWSGIMTEKRFVEMEVRESRNYIITHLP